MVVENTNAVNLVTSDYYNPRINMDQSQYDRERITSAADAMLKLSTSFQPELPDTKPITVMEFSNSPTSVQDHSSDMDDAMRPRSSSMSSKDRAERAFVPENKKDELYWNKRRKNNEAAKRSREKRKMMDMATCEKVSYLVKVNNDLKDELQAMKEYFGLPVDQPFCASNMNDTFPRNNINGQMKKSAEELIFNSFRTIKPAAPAIPLATMASFLQQQQQLVTQAAMEAAYQNSTINTRDVKPVVVIPQNTDEPSVYSPISPVSTSSTTFAPSNLMQQQYKPIDVVTKTKHLILNNDYDKEKYEKLEDEINSDVIAMKRRKISTTIKSDDEDDDCKLQIDESGPSSPKVKNGTYSYPITAHSLTTSTSPNSYDNNHLSTENNTSQSVNVQQKGIPFKLRHKHMNLEQLNSSSADNSSDNSGPKNDYNNESISLPYQLNRLENVPAVINDIDSSSEDSSSYLGESDNSYQSHTPGTGYNERRRRNNIAARKCRENKKLLLKMKEVQSEYLESENRKLKDDLKVLTNEVQSLKDLMSQKQSAERQGEMFVPPPLDVLQKIIYEKSLSTSKQ